ncbi:MAG TPA: RdgB/HAM1 family non-canonical purine NTP pyrophosphatase [Bryobacteraceae bacterium]|nr:RdgB/HAM1 family non-canonical purine NTP pyrophosphatase [Bryobacteraceae bacterium]
MKIYCATTNAGKIREFRQALEPDFDLEMLPGLDRLAAPEETGDTFEENAAQKAVYYARGVSGLVFAEDSGLSVDALGGAPGIRSARFSGLDATDERNNRLLIERMKGVAHRSARYICVVALARDGNVIETFRGEVEGEILHEPRGKNGFGYDPLFYYPPFGCTFGEASAAQKLSVSHRSRALARLRTALARL